MAERPLSRIVWYHPGIDGSLSSSQQCVDPDGAPLCKGYYQHSFFRSAHGKSRSQKLYSIPQDVNLTTYAIRATKVADTLALFSLISSSLRNGQPMPVCVPLMERVAGMSIHTAQDQLELYNVRLNWKTLQVSAFKTIRSHRLSLSRCLHEKKERANRCLCHDDCRTQ